MTLPKISIDNPIHKGNISDLKCGDKIYVSHNKEMIFLYLTPSGSFVCQPEKDYLRSDIVHINSYSQVWRKEHVFKIKPVEEAVSLLVANGYEVDTGGSFFKGKSMFYGFYLSLCGDVISADTYEICKNFPYLINKESILIKYST